MSGPALVWFRSDLRLADHPALVQAAASGRPVLPLFIFESKGRPLGGASRWWLEGSLAALARDLEMRGAPLLLRQGSAAEILPALAQEAGVASVHWNARAEPASAARDETIAARLRAQGVEVHAGPADLLAEPASRRGRSGKPLRLFAPFWRALQAQPEPPPPLPAPARLRGYRGALASDRLADWHLRPRAPDWAQEIAATWRPGEAGAQQRLSHFLDGAILRYAEEHDRLDRESTALLSPHLRWGEIGPRQVWHAVKARHRGPGATAFLREIAWRDFSYHLLQQAGDLAYASLKAEFATFPWREDKAQLAAWQRGRTGFPLVDAAMRQLWRTGWMPNRARMVVASFLVKHLLLPWQAGEAWFWDTLVDADPANNAANWQWVAGCGTDAAPFFRIFNPMAQAAKFDPEGNYVRRWLPAGAAIPAIVEHGFARQRALAAFATMRAKRL